MDDFEIVAEYTGTEPNLSPAASAFARLIKSITNADGTFTDTELEAEFQNWEKEKTAGAGTPTAVGKEH